MEQYQVELWQECNNLCDFCYLGKENRKTSDEVKLKSITELLQKVKNPDFIKNYNNISIIGGDFWQGQLNTPEIKSKFFELMYLLIDYLNQDILENCWMSAVLTIGEQKDLYDLLEYYKSTNLGKIKPSNENSKGLWICTSYDTIGRFHTPEKLKNWEYHMHKLDNYNVHKNTTMILTQDLMEKVLSDELNLYTFMEDFNTSLFLKHAGTGAYKTKEKLEEVLPNFFPRRNTALNFFKKMALCYDKIYDKMFSMQYRADYLIRNFNNNVTTFSKRYKDRETEIDTESFNIRKDCKHITDYNSYFDSDACILCDKNKIWEIIKSNY